MDGSKLKQGTRSDSLDRPMDEKTKEDDEAGLSSSDESALLWVRDPTVQY